MVIRRTLGQLLPNQGHFFNGGTLYKRFTPAGPDHAQVAACAGMADYIDAMVTHHAPDTGRDPLERGQVAHDLMRAHESELLQPLLDAVKDRNAVRLIGPSVAANRAPTVALALDRPGEEVAAELAQHGIMAGGGDFYAGRALSAMGIDPERGVLRLSFTHYTTREEIDGLLNALDDVL
jgi:selenocysteine lyase/cysteine desulfurase